MRRLRRLRALLHIEWREMKRHPRRTGLLALLIAVPVAAVVGGASLARTTHQTLEEKRRQAVGAADLLVERPESLEERRALDALLGTLLDEATATATARWTTGSVRSRSGVQLQVEEVAIAPREAALAASFFDFPRGGPPQNAGEVALSSALLAALALGLQNEVLLEYGGWRRIVGEVRNPEALDQPFLLRTAAAVEHRGDVYSLAAMPPSRIESTAAALRRAGHEVLLRHEVQTSADEATWAVSVLGAIGFFEASLVLAAGFLIGLRRRQVEVGLVAAAGATPRAIGVAILLSSVLLALVGGLLGAASGALGAAVAHPFLDGLNGRSNGPLELHWLAVASALCVGVLAALLAAVIPAVQASRRPIKESLSGRRPQRERSFAFGLVGAACVLVSLCLLFFAPRNPPALGGTAIVGGSVLGVLGFGIASPTLLTVLARGAARLPLAWRLAVRDAGRFRGRNGPVVTAILAGMSMSVTVALLTASIERLIDELPQTYRGDQLLVTGPAAAGLAETLQTELGAIAAAPLQAAYLGAEPIRVRLPGSDPQERGQWLAVGDAALLRALGVDERPPQSSGHLLQLSGPGGRPLEGRGDEEGPAAYFELSTWRIGEVLEPLSATEAPTDQLTSSPLFFVDSATAEARGWTAGPPLDRTVTPWLVRLADTVSPQNLELARRAAAGFAGTSIDAQLLERRPARGFYLATLALCVLTGLIVLLVATSLSAAESKPDEAVLEALGADPGVQRHHRASRAAYLAALGCGLAVPAGFLPIVGLLESANLPLEWVVPWRALALAAVGLPILIYVTGWLTSRRLGALTLWGAAVVVLAAPQPADGQTGRWRDFQGEAFDGSALHGQVTEVTVPTRHAEADGPSLTLRVVRYRTSHPNPGPPILYLAGSPGGSGVELVGRFATHPQLRLLEMADVVAVDQRGTGGSEPKLDGGPPAVRFPLDRAVSRDDVVRSLEALAKRTSSYWTARGVDLAALDTHEAALDLELVRRELELGPVRIYGASYGSHLAAAYLRVAPGGVVRAVLSRVEGPDDTWKEPDVLQRRLERLAYDCAESGTCRQLMPDLLGTLRRLLESLDTDGVRWPVEPDRAGTGRQSEAASLHLGPFDLQYHVALQLARSTTAAEIPAALARFAEGDWSGLVQTALELRTPTLEPMPWATDCASGATTERLEEIEVQRHRPRNLLGDALQAPHFPAACGPCRGCRLPPSFREPLRSDVPVLLVSGEVDARTPPENAERLARNLPRATRVLVLAAGHEARELGSPEYREILQSFLLGEDTADLIVTLPTLPFAQAQAQEQAQARP